MSDPLTSRRAGSTVYVDPRALSQPTQLISIHTSPKRVGRSIVIFWEFMKKRFFRVFIPFCAAVVLVAPARSRSEELQPLPTPVTNNAVTSVHVEGQDLVYSLMGLGPEKTWNSITNAANAFNVKYNKWTPIRSVPGPGRLGASAASARLQVFVLGGFVPDKTGLQAIVGDVSVYDPIGLRWYRGPDLLTAVRDAAVGVYHDRYV